LDGGAIFGIAGNRLGIRHHLGGRRNDSWWRRILQRQLEGILSRTRARHGTGTPTQRTARLILPSIELAKGEGVCVHPLGPQLEDGVVSLEIPTVTPQPLLLVVEGGLDFFRTLSETVQCLVDFIRHLFHLENARSVATTSKEQLRLTFWLAKCTKSWWDSFKAATVSWRA